MYVCAQGVHVRVSIYNVYKPVFICPKFCFFKVAATLVAVALAAPTPLPLQQPLTATKATN